MTQPVPATLNPTLTRRAEVFLFDADTGGITVRSSPDYESRSSYSVTVSVTDGEDALGIVETNPAVDDTVEVTIDVTNVDEAGVLELDGPAKPRVGSVITATLTDPDGGLRRHGVHAVTWKWERSHDGVTWSQITDFGRGQVGNPAGFDLPAGAGYTPTEIDRGMHLRATVTYRDVHGAGKTAQAVTASVVGERESAPNLTVQTLVSGLSLPRDIAFAPDGTMLFTERTGRLYSRLTSGVVQQVTADFSDLIAADLGVLMSIVVDPDFVTNRRFYLYQGDLPRDMEVVVWEMDDRYSEATRVIDPLVGEMFGGGRIRFGPDGLLWIAIHYGDHESPQDLSLLGGKVLRVDRRTGAGASDRPIGTAPLVYTYGHRGPQGLAQRPGTEEMWVAEHGPYWDDEINLLTAGGNYGWNPKPELADDLAQFAHMTDLAAFPDAVEAKWSSGFSTIAPSGAVFLEGADWGEWAGRLAVATLKTQSLRIFELSTSGSFVSQEVAPELSETYGRLRSVVLGPDGALYITTSNATSAPGTDRILRVVPSLPPAFGSSAETQKADENGDASAVVATVTALDPEGRALRYELSGADAGSFYLANDTVGEVRANASLDFETRSSYEVVVTAFDSYDLSGSVTLTIEVGNVDESATLSLSGDDPQVGTALTATLNDLDDVVSTDWTWERSTSRSGPWTAVSGAASGVTTSVYRPVAGDVGYFLRVSAAYTDGHGPNKSRAVVSANSVRAAPVANTAPSFDESAPTRRVAENALARAVVGAAVTATDTDAGDVVL